MKRKRLTHLYAPSALYRQRTGGAPETKFAKNTISSMLAEGSYPLPRGATLTTEWARGASSTGGFSQTPHRRR